MNKVFLIGNLTHDPEAGATQSGVSFCRFSIAVNRRYRKDEENEVDYFNVVCWRSLAEICSANLIKGKRVCIDGSIQTRQYEKDGIKKLAFDIIAENVEFLSPVEKNNSSVSEKGKEVVSSNTPVDDSLPF